MEPLFYYRLVDSLRDSLEQAGRTGYRLWRADRPEGGPDPSLFQEYLGEVRHDILPFLWEGRPLCAHDSVQVLAGTGRRRLAGEGRTGEIVLCGEALVAWVTWLDGFGSSESTLLLGECRAGALNELLGEYGAFDRRRRRALGRITVIGGEPLPRPERLDWDSLVLAPELVDDLRHQVTAFFGLPAEYARLGIPHRRGLLLAGPPGNGKTSALRVIASTRPEPYFLCALRENRQLEQLDAAFDQAALAAPSILCFEDLDSLFHGRGVLSHFLNRLDGLQPLEGVLILATTNHPEELDTALLERPSRFDRVFHFSHPDGPERRRYLREGLGEAFDERLVGETDGFSMAQLKEVRVWACLAALHSGRPGPALADALSAVERLRGDRETVRPERGPGRTIVGFQWSRTRTSGDPTSGEKRSR